jgi:hypothetical protein
MAMQLAKAKELIDIASVNSEAMPGVFVGLAAAIGFIDSYFKEYMLLRRGEIPTSKSSMLKRKKIWQTMRQITRSLVKATP